ncbi:MAG: hypothetical protein WBX11_00195 [Thiobacillaceae bacterium]
MMSNFQDGQHILLELLRRLKPSDMSILEATLATPDSQIATVRNSANDILWSKLAELGLARVLALEVKFPPELTNFQPKSFALTEQGRAVMPELLKLLR